MHVDRDATAVVVDLDAAVGEQGDHDPVGVAGQRLVHRVVHHLDEQVMEPPHVRIADVHGRALADRFQPLQQRQLLTAVDTLDSFRHA